jgi:hypothetical protein
MSGDAVEWKGETLRAKQAVLLVKEDWTFS